MGGSLQRVFSVIMVTEFLLGNFSNGFIILMNCIDRVSNRKFSSVDQILVFLAIFRIVLIWEILVSWFKILDYSFSFLAGTELRVLIYSWTVSNHFSLWLATLLSVFYLFKIANFSRPVFLYLKCRVNKVILMVLLGPLVFLLLNLLEVNKHMENWQHQYERNVTWDSRVRDFARFSELSIFIMVLFSITPFTVAMISCLLLIFSLWNHLQKMQLNSKGHRDSRTKAHMNAVKIIISFLVLYAAYFTCFFISWLSKTHQNKLAHMLCLTVELFYPSTHSCILILGNFRLRQACLSVLRKLRCRLKHNQLTIT